MHRLWLIGAFVLLVPAAATWNDYVRREGLQKPATPIDALQPVYAGYWRFLREARRHVPAGSSYTIAGRNAEEETTIFMISRGLFDDVTPYPATLFGVAQTGGGREARYVLVYGSSECPAGIVLARPVDGGMLCERTSP